MKKSILIIVTVILASCAQDSVLNVRNIEQEPDQAISFNIFTDKGTRAFPAGSVSLSNFHDQFVVFSTKTSTIDNEIIEVFNGDTVAYSAGAWTYAPLRYWDKQANFSFVAIAPSAKYIIYTKTDSVANPAGDYKTKDGGYTLVGTNLQDGTHTAEINKGFTGEDGKDADLMTAQKNNQNGAAHDATVDMLFSHILAKLNVVIGKAKVLDGQNVYIKKVEITGLDDHGTYAQKNYTGATSGWNSSKVNASYKLSFQNNTGILLNSGTGTGENYHTGTPKYFIESIVMPQGIERDNEALKMEYVIGNQTYKYELKFWRNDTLKDINNQDSVVPRIVFPNLMDRSKYTLKLTIDPDAIIFDAAAAEWASSQDTSLIVK